MKRAASILIATTVLLVGGLAVAQHEHAQQPAAARPAAPQPPAALHGGSSGSDGAHAYETVLAGDEIRIYFYDAKGVPLETAGLKGTATVTFPGGQPKKVTLAHAKPKKGEPAVYFCPMHAEATSTQPGECRACGGMKLMTQDFLRGDLKIAAGQPGPVKVAASIEGIGGKKGPLAFQQVIQLGKVSETQQKG